MSSLYAPRSRSAHRALDELDHEPRQVRRERIATTVVLMSALMLGVALSLLAVYIVFTIRMP